MTNSLTKGPFNRMDSEVVPLCNFLGFRHHHQLEGAGSCIYCTLGFCQSYFKNDTISPSKYVLVGAPSSFPTALRHGFKFSSSCGHVASLGGGVRMVLTGASENFFTMAGTGTFKMIKMFLAG